MLQLRGLGQFLMDRVRGASVAMQVQIHLQVSHQVGDGVFGWERLGTLSSSQSVRSASRAWSRG